MSDERDDPRDAPRDAPRADGRAGVPTERRWDDLLGAFALDAVSEEERREIELYLLTDPRARAEVAEHREVAAMLAWSGVSAPEGLWERIASQIDGEAPIPTGELADVLSFDPTRTPAAGRGARRSDVRRRGAGGTGRRWLVAAAAALVVVAVGSVGVAVVGRDDQDPIDAAVDAARRDDEAAETTLVDSAGAVGGEVVIDGSGRGWLLAGELPRLGDDRTYQLWGVIDGEAISLGVLGPRPDVATFTVAGPVTQLVISNEAAGGVVSGANMTGAYAGSLG